MAQVFGSCNGTFASVSAHNSELQADPVTQFSLQLRFLTHIFWFAGTEKRGRLRFEPGSTVWPGLNVGLVAHSLSEEFPQWVPVKNLASGIKGQDQPPLFPLPPSPCQSQRSQPSGSRGNLCGTESPSSQSETLFWLQEISSHHKPPSPG